MSARRLQSKTYLALAGAVSLAGAGMYFEVILCGTDRRLTGDQQRGEAAPQVDKRSFVHRGEAAPQAHGFVVFATQRSGTSFLDTELDKHPCIGMLPEMLQETDFKADTMRRIGVDMLYNRFLDLLSEERRMFWDSAPPSYKRMMGLMNLSIPHWAGSQYSKVMTTRGFDWKLDQNVNESWRWFSPFALKHKLRVIFLRRRNLVRQVFSNMELHRTGTSHQGGNQSSRSGQLAHVRVNLTRFMVEQLDISNKFMDKLLLNASALGLEVMPVWYEDIISQRSSMDAVRSFLLRGTDCNVTPSTVFFEQQVFKKIHPQPLKDLVANWQELESVMSDIPEYASMLKN